MANNGDMEYITVIKKDGSVIQQVVDRGQHLCQNIYVAARKMGTITDDEELPDGDCAPVHETGHIGID
jgi:hypothetical protein